MAAYCAGSGPTFSFALCDRLFCIVRYVSSGKDSEAISCLWCSNYSVLSLVEWKNVL